MASVLKIIKQNPLNLLFIIAILAVCAELAHWDPMFIFIFSAVGVIPLANYIGKATEELAIYSGPKIGGLLNATLGNMAELIITLVAINAGLLELVKASITGSIIGNLLLVLGLSIAVGGLKNGTQKFDRRQAMNQSILLALAVMALVIPSFFSHSIGEEGSFKIEALSLGVAGVMIILYVLGVIYSLKVLNSPLSQPTETKHAEWSIGKSIIVLAIATIGIVVLSELLVGAVEHVVQSWGLSEFFLGIILIPIIGNAAEHLVAVQVALRNQMDLSVEIAVSSSLQIALFVAPFLVFISLAMGHPLSLIFNPFELAALMSAVFIVVLVSLDGESNWLEGSALLAVFLILSIAFFLLPA
ncbi:MAG: calcium/proton exchanger [Anaerolineae bacterium]|nr:calcium/proton exchanger [Anaerolineae bacterium]